MDKKPTLWDKNLEVVKPLREPKSIFLKQDDNSVPSGSVAKPEESRDSPVNKTNSSCFTDTKAKSLDKLDSDFIIANSNLKADAAEWYPWQNVPNTSTSGSLKSSVQDRLKINKKPQEDTYSQQSDLENNEYFSNYPNTVDDSHDFIRLKQIITTLTKDPGQFDNLLDIFMETLMPYFEAPFENFVASSAIAQLLVEQGINNPNFRYTGARLCWFIEQRCPEFRAELHMKCKKQVEENADKQNVLLFIAELYTQLPHLNVYGSLLIDCFKQLLSKGDNDDIKCICQALKLTGYSLEQSNKNDLDQVFSQLDSLASSDNSNVSVILKSIFNLRLSNWGHSNDADNPEIDSDEYYYGDLPHTMFYSADGEAFTHEESEFLATHMQSNVEYLCDNSDPDELCDPEPEMDEEIQAAFKEFVKSSKRN